MLSSATIGPITEQDIRDYTCGQCAALAIALHQRTGWSLFACDWTSDSDLGTEIDPDRDWPGHVFVVMPDGRGLDITGSFRWPASVDPHGGGRWAPISVPRIAELAAEEQVAPDISAAARLVGPVLTLA